MSIGCFAQNLDSIANSEKWKALLHIQDENTSEINDINFFASKQKSSLVELEYLVTNPTCENVCKFPARYKYISEHIDLNISFSHCQEFQAYLQLFDGNSASIVFASPFLESPTSYFGHTFIKINNSNNLYFSPTLGYAAELPSTIGMYDLFSKGLFGGFNGKYMYSPYYMLIESYNITEQRTLYEYELTLTSKEIQDMIWHSFELQNINIPYKFFTENCAYEIFWLLQNAAPSKQLISELKSYVVPFETIEVLRRNNMIISESVNPALIDKIYFTYNDLSGSEKEFFEILKNSKNKKNLLSDSNLSENTKNKMSEILNGYYDILFKKFKTSYADYFDVKNLRYSTSNHLIKTRYEPKKPHAIEVGFSVGRQPMNKFYAIVKPALFDRFETRDNMISESTLQLLNFGVSGFDGNTQIDNIDIIKLESFNKQFAFYEPNSFRFYGGFDRSFQDSSIHPLLELGIGVTRGYDNISAYGIFQLATYPTEEALNLQILAGTSFWISNYHIVLDSKHNIFESHGSARKEYKMNLLVPFLKSQNFRLGYDFLNDTTKIGFEYKF